MFSQDSEPVVLKRDVKAIVVPAGMEMDLTKGELVYITQAMGGSFTIYFEGNLFRISGMDADALGKEPIEAPVLPEDATDEEFEKIVWDQIRTCYDPEIPVNIYEMGMIYEVRVEENGYAYVKMTLTTPACPVAGTLPGEVEHRVAGVEGVSDAKVELVWDPPWTQDMLSEAARLQLGLM